MPISISEYATPRFIKKRESYPWVTQKNYNYANLTINPKRAATRYQGDTTGRINVAGWKLPGYNPNHNSIKPEVFNPATDTTARSFRPY